MTPTGLIALAMLMLMAAYFLAGVFDPCSWAPINLMTERDLAYCLEVHNLERLRAKEGGIVPE